MTKYIDDILLVAGVASLSAGMFMVDVPVGFMTLGVCFIAIAFFIMKRR